MWRNHSRRIETKSKYKRGKHFYNLFEFLKRKWNETKRRPIQILRSSQTISELFIQVFVLTARACNGTLSVPATRLSTAVFVFSYLQIPHLSLSKLSNLSEFVCQLFFDKAPIFRGLSKSRDVVFSTHIWYVIVCGYTHTVISMTLTIYHCYLERETLHSLQVGGYESLNINALDLKYCRFFIALYEQITEH